MAKLNNDEYWAKRKRQAKRWIRENLRDDDAMQRKLLAEYQTAAKGIQAEINREYMSYAQRAGLDISDAMQAVSDEDVTEFAQEAAQMVADHNFSDEANARLKLYNATMRINRLEYLKSRIGLEMLKATANSEDMISRAVGQAYTDTTQREAGILQNYADHFDPARVINGTIKQYSPNGFSRNVWQNQDVIMAKLDQQLTQAMVRGLNPRRIAQELRPLVNQAGVSAAYAAERIARTEMARAQNQAQLDSFADNDVDKVIWIAEPGACETCKPRDDKSYKREDVPELPAHPNCRCALSADPDWASVDDEIDKYLNSNSEPDNHEVPVNGADSDSSGADISPERLGTSITRGKPMTVEQADQHNANPKYMGGAEGWAKQDEFEAIRKRYLALRSQVNNAESYEEAASLTKQVNDLVPTYNSLVNELNKYRRSAHGYGVNCQRCAPAYELRRRGYNVEALPNNGGTDHDVYDVPANMWLNEDGTISTPKIIDATTNKQVTAQLLEQMKPGERGTIQWSWKGANSAHIVNVERTSKGLLVVDAQPGKTAESFEEYMGANHFKTRITRNHVQYRTGVFYNRVDDKRIDTENIGIIVRGVR